MGKLRNSWSPVMVGLFFIIRRSISKRLFVARSGWALDSGGILVLLRIRRSTKALDQEKSTSSGIQGTVENMTQNLS